MEHYQFTELRNYIKSLNETQKEIEKIEKERNRIIEEGLLEIAKKL